MNKIRVLALLLVLTLVVFLVGCTAQTKSALSTSSGESSAIQATVIKPGSALSNDVRFSDDVPLYPKRKELLRSLHSVGNITVIDYSQWKIDDADFEDAMSFYQEKMSQLGWKTVVQDIPDGKQFGFSKVEKKNFRTVGVGVMKLNGHTVLLVTETSNLPAGEAQK